MENVLADQENIDCAEIKIVKVWHSGHAFSSGMHTSIELRLDEPHAFVRSCSVSGTYHYSLALVLEYVT